MTAKSSPTSSSPTTTRTSSTCAAGTTTRTGLYPYSRVPRLMPAQPQMEVWSVSTSGGGAALLGDGDAPAISPDGKRVVFTNGGAVMVAPVDGSVAARRLFFDRGEDSELHWSPDGSALAFVSTRTDHSFIGIYRNDATPIEFLEPSTSQDFMPRWSPDATEIAFVRLPGDGGPPQNPFELESHSVANLGR